MREFIGLFRGKRIDNGEWVEGNLLTLTDGRYFIVNNIFGACIDAKGNFINTEAPFVCEVDPDTVGECTGLRDKDGKLIFEGDAIKIEHDDYAFDGMSLEYRTEQGVVAHDGIGWGIVVEKYKGTDVWSDFFHVLGLTDRIANWTFEIIGNIHDNPELKGGEGDG